MSDNQAYSVPSSSSRDDGLRSNYHLLLPATSHSESSCSSRAAITKPEAGERIQVDAFGNEVSQALQGCQPDWQQDRDRWSQNAGQDAGLDAPFMWPQKGLPVQSAPALADDVQGAHAAYRHAAYPSGGKTPFHFAPDRLCTMLGGRPVCVLFITHDYAALHENQLEVAAARWYPLPVHRLVGPSSRACDLGPEVPGHQAIAQNWYQGRIMC